MLFTCKHRSCLTIQEICDISSFKLGLKERDQNTNNKDANEVERDMENHIQHEKMVDSEQVTVENDLHGTDDTNDENR